MRKTIAAITLTGALLLTGANPASAATSGWTSTGYWSYQHSTGLITHGQGYVGSQMKAYTTWSSHAVCVTARYMYYGTYEYHARDCQGSAAVNWWPRISQHYSEW